MVNNNYYNLNFTLEALRKNYQWSSTCQGTVSQAIECFLESNDFEDESVTQSVSVETVIQ